MAWKARATSLPTSEKSAFNTAFFGLKTTSTGAISCPRCNRTASRMRRLMRLRSTEPPRPRPTVKPTLAPRISRAGDRFSPRLSPGDSPNSRRKKNAVNSRPKCRCPCWYTRSKSACLSKRAVRGTFRDLFRSANPIVAGSWDWRVVRLTIIPRTRIQFWIAVIGDGRKLLPEAGLHRHPLASLGATSRKDRAPALSLHSFAKSVRLRATATVGLERALGHEY